MQKDEKGITIKKEDNFSEWYTQIVQKAELIEYSRISGCYIIRPRAYAIWEKIQEYFDKKIKELGVKNCYFPLFIPETLLQKEAKHFEGFSPEVAWVTEGGSSKLNEKLAIRPTSETIMYDTYSKWIRSYKDLPLKLNQWCNVVRWEFKHGVPFLRSREFLWQEGHTAFATKKEAEEEAYQILEYYTEIFEKVLAVPVFKGRKTENEKFAGADMTLSVEAMLPNGKAVQGATSHNLGQNFSKSFDIKFTNKNEQFENVYQNSWGISTRSIGIAVMIHSDDKGLVLPPNVAENKIVIIPILADKDKNINKKARELGILLKQFNPIVDNREGYSPGWKYNEWELKGIPIRIEIGPRDLKSKQAVIVLRHNGKKEIIKLSSLKSKIQESLETIQDDLYKKAKIHMKTLIDDTTDSKSFEKTLKSNRIALIDWCNNSVCEEKIKNTYEGVKSINIPLNTKPKGKKCISCGQESQVRCFFGKCY